MLESTGLCPFHATCKTRRDLRRFEKRLLKERREFYSDASYLERVEYNTFMSDYQRSFMSIMRIQERCSSNSRRCLRFWQILRLENKYERSGQPAHDGITQVTTGWQCIIPFQSPLSTLKRRKSRERDGVLSKTSGRHRHACRESAKHFDPTVYGCYCRKYNDGDDLHSLIPDSCALWFIGYSVTADVCIKVA